MWKESLKKSRDLVNDLISYLETSSNSGSTHTAVVMGERGSNKTKLRITVNEEIEKSFSKTCEPWCSSFERLCLPFIERQSSQTQKNMLLFGFVL